MTDEEKTLATQLMLLFDGKTSSEIAQALALAIDTKRAELVAWDYNYLVGINSCIAVSPADIYQKIDDDNEDDSDETVEFVGTHAQLVDYCQGHAWGDTGDMFSIERDDLFDHLEKDGLIKRTPRPESEQ